MSTWLDVIESRGKELNAGQAQDGEPPMSPAEIVAQVVYEAIANFLESDLARRPDYDTAALEWVDRYPDEHAGTSRLDNRISSA